jgi:pyrimidine-nucleoside phosphorylase
MIMTDLIAKKVEGKPLTQQEITYFIQGYTQGTIPDYQVSSLLMAIKFKGMNDQETADLTYAMMHSGDVMDLSSIQGVKADKHSTGGVGDKTSLVLGPLVAAAGLKIAKMSGRGLSHTGGTLDKLEAIPGMSIARTQKQFIEQVNRIGLSIIGQTGSLVPADKKLYALRDVTGTVQSVPLIASSIMSKKLASGADTILLDVKFGSGAFMKTLSHAKGLAQAMVNIGKAMNKDTRAILTDMDQPLGFAIGNILEVKEAIDTLKGQGPSDLTELCIYAGAMMLMQGGRVKTLTEGKRLLKNLIVNGQAFEKFKSFVSSQGGDIRYIEDPSKFEQSAHVINVVSDMGGYVESLNALSLGEIAMKLGAGRATKDDIIDYTAGIVLNKKIGDEVNQGDVLAVIHTNLEQYEAWIVPLRDSFTISSAKVRAPKIIHATVK